VVEASPSPPPAEKSSRLAIAGLVVVILGVLASLVWSTIGFKQAKEASGIDKAIVLADKLATGGTTSKVDAQLAQARCTKAKTEIESLKAAANMYRIMTGVLPEKIEDLKKPLEQVPEGIWDGTLEDPWGHPYEYEKLDTRKFVIRSKGRDGEPGGEGEDADIDTDHLESDK
jgi:general secretion pathway protein G